MSAQNPREIALRVLQQRLTGGFVEDWLERILAEAQPRDLDRRLCQELSYGIVRWQSTLDWLIARKTASRTQKPLLQNVLRLGIYQIFWLDRVPNHAAVHETVQLAKHAGFGPQAGFVNAILRAYTREFDTTRQLLAELKTTTPYLGYSHPEWLTQRWQARWGTVRLHRLLDWNNRTPKTFARVNTLKTDPASLLAQWRQEKVEYDFVRHDWFNENLVFELKAHPALGKMESFQKGYFYIQDPSTLLSVETLGPIAGESILDLCAAPGGKLTYLAQRMSNQGSLVAHDIHPERLKLIEENCHRLGVSCVVLPLGNSLTVGTSASLPSLPPSPVYDKILIDAPCSNTGVMGRRVDLRWRIRPEEIQRLTAAQLELLVTAASLLKPGGTLVYSTCSLELEENENVVKHFLESRPDYRLEYARQLTPFEDQVDGAYVAKLQHQVR